ncbi:MAG: phosphoribosylformylglycinamidine cyclo-ligase [Planctomycetaceae bacterium]|nr:MAG: phosphoribosylformylglycinamidine cyclo-ligase [Planctomycetaceae bacterium]
MTEKVSYKNAGVDINKANLFVKKIQPLVKGTSRKEVMGGIGNFGGLFHLDMAKFNNPILVSSTDGVGTKLRIAQMMNKHDTVGIDLVAMSVNDILVHGAEPLFFLDYIATGKIDVKKNVKIVEGIAKGCVEAGCALIGGEIAEMPDFYKDEDYDLAGFCVGVVDADKLIDGSEISVGDRIIGIASCGIHSNGFSLARKVLFEQEKLKIKDKIEGLDHSIGTELLRPTRIYVKPILNLMKNFNIKGIAHITGGGFIENIPRILPDRCRAIIQKDSWDILPIFNIIQERGTIDRKEMLRVFNMGIGMMVVVPEKDLHDVLERLEGLGERAYAIGVIDNRDKKQKHVSFV